ncbi:uncharacterized protein LOC134455969 [Engraulis encrasicolus]|uniref:uncharacterized protein LOC134455969 n=1 Tax=Engraulis encrasicolus TaxID=184585 RepID=UPI002FD196DE
MKLSKIFKCCCSAPMEESSNRKKGVQKGMETLVATPEMLQLEARPSAEIHALTEPLREETPAEPNFYLHVNWWNYQKRSERIQVLNEDQSQLAYETKCQLEEDRVAMLHNWFARRQEALDLMATDAKELTALADKDQLAGVSLKWREVLRRNQSGSGTLSAEESGTLFAEKSWADAADGQCNTLAQSATLSAEPSWADAADGQEKTSSRRTRYLWSRIMRQSWRSGQINSN